MADDSTKPSTTAAAAAPAPTEAPAVDPSIEAAAKQAAEDAAVRAENPTKLVARAANPDVGGEGFPNFTPAAG